jgi:tetratricopeptide (TPR) repeat protein
LATWKNTSALDVLAKAKADALRAVELDPTYAEAYAALGSVNFWLEWDWAEADANIKQALALNPSNPNTHLLYADYLVSQKQVETAASHIRQAIQLDPVSLLTNGISAYAYLHAGLCDEAIAQANRMLELEPKSPAAHECLISAYQYKGAYQEARDLILKRMIEGSAKPESIAAFKQGEAKAALDRWERRQVDRAKEAIAKGEQGWAFWSAQFAAHLGENDLAFAWLEKSYTERLPMLVFLGIHPAWAALRGDSRFTTFVRRMGLTQ